MKNLIKFVLIIICLFSFGLFAQGKNAEGKSLKVLILGGTTFLGPHLTDELLSHGHKVTYFNRGNEHCYFPEVERLQGDRYGNLKALEGRKWDAIIDTSGYIPRVVEASSKILAKATDHYTFISTISVYDNFNQFNIDEDFPLAKLDGICDENITGKTYGPFKAGCEKVIRTYFPENSLIVRPGLIVGPYDPTDRFTYWVRRVSEGGNVLVPNTLKHRLQIIDVRDLAKWIVKMVEERAVGIYNATGPKDDLSFERFIEECSQFAKRKVNLIWVNETFLIDNKLDNWNKFPLWLSAKSNMIDLIGLFSINSKKAEQKGLSCRPLSETISATLKWDEKRIDRKMKVGLTLEEEENILKNMESRTEQ